MLSCWCVHMHAAVETLNGNFVLRTTGTTIMYKTSLRHPPSLSSPPPFYYTPLPPPFPPVFTPTCVEQHEAASAVGVFGLTRCGTLTQQGSHLVT